MSQPPEKFDTRPLYDRAAEVLEQLIERGQYKPGDQLPSEEMLARQMGISRATLREVLGNLENAGVITRRHGIGTFVTAPARGRIQGGMEQLLSFRSLQSSAGESQQRSAWTTGDFIADHSLEGLLLVPPGTSLLRIEMTATIDDAPFAYLDSYIQKNLVDAAELESYADGSLLDFLVDKDELRISYTHSNVHAIAAEPRVASRLKTSAGAPVLHLVETFYTDTGQPAFHSLNYFVTEKLDFYIVRRMIRR